MISIDSPYVGLAASDMFEVCDMCGVVDTDQERIRIGHPCSACGSPSAGGTCCYGLPVDTLLNLIEENCEEDPAVCSQLSSHLSAVIFFCTLGEVLLEHFLTELMLAQAIPRSVMKRLLNDSLSAKQRVDKLFPALTASKWADELLELEEKDGRPYRAATNFYLRAVAARNLVLHRGATRAVSRDMRTNCATHSNNYLYLFATLHNRFARPFYGPQRPYLPRPPGA